MSIATALLGEFEHEAKITRTFLERIPHDKLTWKPHDKSHSIGSLGLHIAMIPGTTIHFGNVDTSEIPDVEKLFPHPQSVQSILDAHDHSAATVRQLLPTFDDARLMTNWSATKNGKVVATMPKFMALRLITFNHWIHHRGQLGVHLRLAGAKVPSSYGPSGDEV